MDTFAYTPAPNIETTLLGLTLTKVEGAVGGDEVLFKTKEGRSFRLWHSQDCCESVRVTSVTGNRKLLLGTPLTSVREVIETGGDHWTRTTYHLATDKGSVSIQWLGESNGYYSESVSFIETTPTRG